MVIKTAEVTRLETSGPRKQNKQLLGNNNQKNNNTRVEVVWVDRVRDVMQESRWFNWAWMPEKINPSPFGMIEMVLN